MRPSANSRMSWLCIRSCPRRALQPFAGRSPDPRSCWAMKAPAPSGPRPRSAPAACPTAMRYWSLIPVIGPSLETTTIPSASVSSVASTQRDGQPAARIGVLAVAGVPDGNRHGRAAVDRHQRAGDLQRQVRTVTMPACRRERAASGWASAAQPAEDPQEPAALVLGEQDVVPDAEQFFAGIAEEPLRGRVHESDGSVRGQQQKRIGALLEQGLFNPSSHGDTGPQSDGS